METINTAMFSSAIICHTDLSQIVNYQNNNNNNEWKHDGKYSFTALLFYVLD